MVEVEKERYFKTEYYYENVWEEGLVDNQGQRFSDYVRTRKKRELEVRSKKDAIRIETYTETMTARHYLRFLNKKSHGKHLDKGKEIINKNLRINKKSGSETSRFPTRSFTPVLSFSVLQVRLCDNMTDSRR